MYTRPVGELYHHGIKGMRWGIRRFQKKDGTLTAEGKKRYSDDSQPKQTKAEQYYQKYKSAGYSNKRAKELADGRVKTERALRIIGGVAITGLAAYAAYRYYDKNVDRFISSDKALQTVHMGDAADRLKPGNPFYATYTKADNTIYSSKYFSHFTDASNVTRFYTKDGIKVASEKTGQKIFRDLVKNDPEVARYSKAIDQVLPSAGKKAGYRAFNYSLVLKDDTPIRGLSGLEHEKVHKKFYDELKKRGYGAVMDVNDSKMEGFSFNPVIVFDDQMKHVISSTKATKEQLGGKQLAKGVAYAAARGVINKPPTMTLAAGGAMYLSTLGLYKSSGRDLDARINFIAQYKKDHPNSELSDAQIAKIYERERAV